MRYCKLKLAQMVKFDDLMRGERFGGVKKEGFIKKRNLRLMFSVTHIITGIDLRFTANKEKMQDDTDVLVQDSAHTGLMI